MRRLRVGGQPLRQRDRRVNHRHLVAPALLAGGHGHGLPMVAFFLAALAFEFEHAALGQQRGEAGRAQLGGFFYQPIHALVGGDAGQQMHRAAVFALQRLVRHQAHLHMAAAHFDNLRLPLAVGSGAVEQGDGIARLQAQHLHMAGGTRRQVELGTSGHGQGAMKAGHKKRSVYRLYFIVLMMFI